MARHYRAILSLVLILVLVLVHEVGLGAPGVVLLIHGLPHVHWLLSFSLEM